jgi:hypothetical protein
MKVVLELLIEVVVVELAKEVLEIIREPVDQE